MHAEASNVVPFPVSDEARARLSLVRFRRHAEALDSELAALAGGNIKSAGDWAKRTATPSVRIACIRRYLAVAVAGEANLATGRRQHQQYVTRTQQDLEEVLSATGSTLKLLGTMPDAAGRQQALQDLDVYRVRHQVILQRLDELIGDAS